MRIRAYLGMPLCTRTRVCMYVCVHGHLSVHSVSLWPLDPQAGSDLTLAMTFSVAERMETANKQLAAKECEGSEDNRKTISQLLTQSEYITNTATREHQARPLQHSTSSLNIPLCGLISKDITRQRVWGSCTVEHYVSTRNVIQIKFYFI